MIQIGRAAGRDSCGQFLALTALLANPIMLKWLSLPMAEGVALMLCLVAVALFLAFLARRSILSLILACVIGGFATITRIEALFLVPVFGLLAAPEKRNISWRWLLAGLVVFFLPLFWYFLWLRGTAGAESAYISEFKSTLPTADFLKNLAYNILVPFGFMHWPVRSFSASELLSVTGLAGVIWIGLGECVFVGGLVAALAGRLGPRLRATSILFVTYAFVHSFWYYRYERFMLMALPLAAIVWASAIQEVCARLLPKRQHVLLPLIQLMIVASGFYFGNFYSLRHRAALQQDTGGLRFREIAAAVNSLNSESHSPVLTDLGPHLAYHLDAHTYLDTGYKNYWKRAFPPERTLGEMERLGIRFVVIKLKVNQWFEEHAIPPEIQSRFKVLTESGVSILEYTPGAVSDS